MTNWADDASLTDVEKRYISRAAYLEASGLIPEGGALRYAEAMIMQWRQAKRPSTPMLDALLKRGKAP